MMMCFVCMSVLMVFLMGYWFVLLKMMRLNIFGINGKSVVMDLGEYSYVGFVVVRLFF